MAAVFLSNVKYYHKLLERLTAGLYKAYPEMKILEALCSLLIRGDRRDRSSFNWYEKAMKAISILQGCMNIFCILFQRITDMPFQKKCCYISLMTSTVMQTSRSVL